MRDRSNPVPRQARNIEPIETANWIAMPDRVWLAMTNEMGMFAFAAAHGLMRRVISETIAGRDFFTK